LEILKTATEVLVGLVGLSILVFVHELGHLIAAKLLKLKVETFSLGYGKKLIGFKWGETTYQISWFPFGGFCKMQGEHLFAKAVEENLDKMPDDEEHYYNAPAWKRIIVSLAGPVANAILALLFITGLYLVGFNEYSSANRIVLASEFAAGQAAGPTYPANKAGLATGDLITAINGKEIRNFLEIRKAIVPHPKDELLLTVIRRNETLKLEITPELDTENSIGFIGIMEWKEPVIEKLGPKTEGLNPWLKQGDRIISLGGKPVEHVIAFLHMFKEKPSELPMVVERNGQQVTGSFAMSYYKKKTPLIDLEYKTGVYRSPSCSFFEAFSYGIEECGSIVSGIFKFFSLIPQKINLSRAVGGPIKTTVIIGLATGESVTKGFDYAVVQFIHYVAALSMTLGIMNLLPLPMLDGGYVILFAAEWIRRKSWRPRFLFRFQMIGIGIFAIILVFILFSDVSFLINLITGGSL